MNMRRLVWIGLILILTGCAAPTQPTAASAVDVSGVWVGTWSRGGGASGFARLVLEQQGNKVSGTYDSAGNLAFSGPLQGVVEGNYLSYNLTNGSNGAELTVNGDEMVGYNKVGSRLILHRERR